jgi:hypothetical protein
VQMIADIDKHLVLAQLNEDSTVYVRELGLDESKEECGREVIGN